MTFHSSVPLIFPVNSVWTSFFLFPTFSLSIDKNLIQRSRNLYHHHLYFIFHAKKKNVSNSSTGKGCLTPKTREGEKINIIESILNLLFDFQPDGMKSR